MLNWQYQVYYNCFNMRIIISENPTNSVNDVNKMELMAYGGI